MRLSSTANMTVSALNNASFPASGTLTFWIKTDNPMTTGNVNLFDGYASTRNHVFIRFTGVGKIQAVFQRSDGTYVTVFDLTGFPQTTWAHVAVVWNTATDRGQVYVNGALLSDKAINDATWTPNQQTVLFRDAALGTYDDIRLYNTALTASEVTEVYSYTGGGASDTTPPTVSMTAPAGGATVSGSAVTLSATASDNIGVSGVQFLLDGANLGTEDTSSPYSITWNTIGVTNGAHTLSARARDAAGNTTTATNVSVTVNNGLTPLGWWKLDGNASDSGSGGKTGTLLNSPTWVTGHIDQAMHVSSTAEMIVSALDNANFPANGTLAFWIKTDNPMTTGNVNLFDGYASTRNHVFIRFTGVGMIQIAFQKSNNTYVSAFDLTGFPQTTWAHVAVVWNTATDRGQVYVNGALLSDKAINDATWTPNQQTVLFRDAALGTYDDIRLYNTALTASEVTEVYSYTGSITITPPSSPTNLTGTSGNTTASLSWSASSGATSYTVKRSTTNGGPYTAVATGLTGTSHADTGLTNGTTYYYVVSAVNADGESANSAQASVTPFAMVVTTGTTPLGWWKLDGNASDSGSGWNTGTLTGSPTWVAGRSDQAMHLSSTANMTVSALNNASFPASGTLTFWIKTDNPMTTGNVNLFDGYASTRNHVFIRFTGVGKIQAVFQRSDGTYVTVFDLTGFPQTTWAHVAVVWNTATDRGQVYVNGALLSDKAINDATWTPNQQTVLFRDAALGTYDDIRLYNTALTASEVTEVYSYTGGGASDTTTPTVSMTAPAGGATVSGSAVTLSATASDNIGV